MLADIGATSEAVTSSIIQSQISVFSTPSALTSVKLIRCTIILNSASGALPDFFRSFFSCLTEITRTRHLSYRFSPAPRRLVGVHAGGYVDSFGGPLDDLQATSRGVGVLDPCGDGLSCHPFHPPGTYWPYTLSETYFFRGRCFMISPCSSRGFLSSTCYLASRICKMRLATCPATGIGCGVLC